MDLDPLVILWMVAKSVRSTRTPWLNHCLLVVTGESNHSRVLEVVRNGFRPSAVFPVVIDSL